MKQLIIIVFLASMVLAQKNTDDPELNSKYKITKIKPGDGKNFPSPGDKVYLHYTGTFPESGKKFDSSLDRNQPLDFQIGKRQVIQGWEDVVMHMSLGEKLYFICPSDYAYGQRGAGGVIPPNTDIAFEVELLQIGSKKMEL